MDWELDDIDRHILALLQDNCKRPLAKIGDEVGLSAPSVQDRVRKLEENGVLVGYHALLDARMLGKDVTAFIGISIRHPRGIEEFEKAVASIDEILECHHVTGGYTLLVKAKTESTKSLEALIADIRSVEGVERTETMIVLSTTVERTRVPVGPPSSGGARRTRRSADRQSPVHHLKGV